MAWNSREEEVLARISDHVMASSKAEKRAFVRLMTRLIFPQEGTIGAQCRWLTSLSVTRVTVWGQAHLLNNLRLVVIREALGLGSHHYCIIRSEVPNFASKVLLLMWYLPREKLSIWPRQPPLEGPFLQPLWRAQGEGIFQRDLPKRELPPWCPRYYSRWCDSRICLTLRQEEEANN